MGNTATAIPAAPKRGTAAAPSREPDTRLGPMRRFGSVGAELRVQVRNWQRIAFACAGVAGLAVIGMLMKSGQPTMIPYVVSIDKHSGQYVNIGVPPRQEDAPDVVAPIVQYTLKQFIFGVRTVTPDQDMQTFLVTNYVKPFVPQDGQSASFINDFYKANNPFELGSKQIVTVDVDIPTAITATSYQIDWTETTEDTAGHVQKKVNYEGTATTAFSHVPEDQQKFNPLGIFIKEIHWTVKTDATTHEATQ